MSTQTTLVERSTPVGSKPKAPARAADLAVETWGLCKDFKGSERRNVRLLGAVIRGVRELLRPAEKRRVVDNISLSVARGEFFGIVGPNGAGKTTFLKLLCCVLYPDGGRGSVNNYDLLRERSSVRRSVVISPAQAWNGVGLLWQLTGHENLMFRARLCGVGKAEAKRRADYVLERLGMARKASEHSWNWSAGELHKMTLAMTFIARTPLVILDEPTSHLDPRTSRQIREFAREELNGRNGQTVIFSTHYLDEADMLCDRVAVLHQGRLLACDAPAELKRTYVPDRIPEVRALNYTPVIGERVKEKLGLVELLEQYEDVTTGQVKLRPKSAGAPVDVESLRCELESEGVKVLSAKRVAPALEDVYFQLTQEETT
jgi:ABC-2 type transport system ATP-binding protein